MTETEATLEVMEMCKTCKKENCYSPCGAAQAILAKHNMRYLGNDK